MRHVRSLAFDDLEGRRLLSKLHHAVGPAEPPASRAGGPLVLQGTLAVQNKAATVSVDGYGDQTTVTPVSGVLSGVGEVRGVWDESVDSLGSYLGPDTIQLRNSRGSFVIAFDATTLGQAQPTPQGLAYDVASQHLEGGSGSYAGTSETGLIQVNTDARQTTFTSLTLGPGRLG